MSAWVRFRGRGFVFLVLALVPPVGVLARTGGQAAATAASGQAAPLPQGVELFETRIRPLLAANCYACHGESAMAGLRVDSREGLLRGGQAGPVLVPGDPEKSALLKVLQHAEGFPRMPRGRAKLQATDIEAVAEWVRTGAVWPGAADAPIAPVASHERVITAAERSFWSFQPIRKAALPDVRDAAWPRTDIDRFVLARLERDGLAPVGPRTS